MKTRKYFHTFLILSLFFSNLLIGQVLDSRVDEFLFDDKFENPIRRRPPTGDEVTENIRFTYTNSAALFSHSLIERAMRAQQDAWFFRQYNLLEQEIEKQLGTQFPNFQEAQRAFYKNLEKSTVLGNVGSSKSKYSSRVNTKTKVQKKFVSDYKLLDIRANEIRSGQILSSFGHLQHQGTPLNQLTSLSQIEALKTSDLNALKNNAWRLFNDQKVYNYLEYSINRGLIANNLNHPILTELLQKQLLHYNGFDRWQQLDLMQLYLNRVQIPLVLIVPIYPNTFGHSTFIENFATTNRSGGISIFHPSYLSDAIAAALSNNPSTPAHVIRTRVTAAYNSSLQQATSAILNTSNTDDILAEAAVTGLGRRNNTFLDAKPALREEIVKYFKANNSSKFSQDGINYLLNQYHDKKLFVIDKNVYSSSIAPLIGDINDPARAFEFCPSDRGIKEGLPHFGNVLSKFFEIEQDNNFKGFIIREMFDAKGIRVPSQNVVANSWYGENFKFANQVDGCIRIEFLNDFTNILLPDCQKNEYEDAIRKGDIVFSKKYGWVDASHAFVDTDRNNPFIGVKNLWRQLKNPPLPSQISDGYYSVNYKQDVILLGLSVGIERQYLVKPGLSFAQRKSVALAILQDVSLAFESLQSLHPTSTSSFEPADLPSNMLSFYRHVEGYTEQQIRNIIETVSVNQSLEVFRLYPCTFVDKKYKNKTFKPVRFESPYTSSDFGVPNVFNTVQPLTIKSIKEFGTADLILFQQDIISR